MTTLDRMVGAARLDARVYEGVEADPTLTGQAVAVVLMASIADAIGSSGTGLLTAPALAAGIVGAVAAWVAWAVLTYLIGTQLLPEAGTQASVGQLLRTLGFASAPGVLRAAAGLPVVGLPIYWLATIWMIVTMVVAVRQALDYTSTVRAVGVCVIGWALSLLAVAAVGLLFAPRVS